jgi:hypothetical protein
MSLRTASNSSGRRKSIARTHRLTSPRTPFWPPFARRCGRFRPRKRSAGSVFDGLPHGQIIATHGGKNETTGFMGGFPKNIQIVPCLDTMRQRNQTAYVGPEVFNMSKPRELAQQDPRIVSVCNRPPISQPSSPAFAPRKAPR